MRIWDLNPGYLNRQSLLGEHRELHGMVSILVQGKRGYARHPETLRWVGYGWSLKQRHALLVAEMRLRGYQHHSPIRTRSNFDKWPKSFIDEPTRQFQILALKYRDKESGRIPLPQNVQQLWAQHKYSVMARDVGLYQKLGKAVSKPSSKNDFSTLTHTLTEVLRQQPSKGGIRNALHHMWGYVADGSPGDNSAVSGWSLLKLSSEVQRRAIARNEPYLMASTALGELKAWVPSAR